MFKVNRRLSHLLALVIALAMIFSVAAFATEGVEAVEKTAEEIAVAVDSETEPATLDENEGGLEEGEEIDLEDVDEGTETELIDEEIDVEEPEIEEPEIEEPDVEEPVIITPVPPTADASSSVLPLIAGFSAVAVAAFVLRRRATK